MAASPVIHALRDKHATLSGQIAALEKQVAQHRADLMHVDAVLRLFAPEVEVAAIGPKALRGAMSSSGRVSCRALCWTS